MAFEGCKPNADVSFGGKLSKGSVDVASVCDIKIELPSIPFPPKLTISGIPFPPPFPIPKFGFKLSCDPKKPIDVTAGLAWGGGKLSCSDKDPNDIAA